MCSPTSVAYNIPLSRYVDSFLNAQDRATCCVVRNKLFVQDSKLNNQAIEHIVTGLTTEYPRITGREGHRQQTAGQRSPQMGGKDSGTNTMKNNLKLIVYNLPFCLSGGGWPPHAQCAQIQGIRQIALPHSNHLSSVAVLDTFPDSSMM